MRTRIIIAIVVVLVIAGGVWVALRTGANTAVRLVPAWQLLAKESYRAMGVLDPFVSWSPDSRSVLCSVFGLGTQRDRIFRWNVGEKKLHYITAGASPNYVTDDEFIYLKKQPKGVFVRSLSTGREREIAGFKQNEFFPDVTGISYDPKRKTVAVRMTEMTQFRTPGPDEFDLNGKRIGSTVSRLGEQIVDSSCDPSGKQCAILVQEKDTPPVSLQIADANRSRGREITTGKINSVAWSPDGRAVAYTDGKLVVAVRPRDGARVIVAGFGEPQDKTDERYAARLIWSPNSQYLAVFVYVPNLDGDYPLYYVLDMSKLKWE